MKNVFKNNNQGFTLIELLIYMGISTIIVVVLTSFMVDVLKNAAKTKITKEVQQNARFVISKITQEIRNAQTATVINPGQIDLVNPSGNMSFCIVNEAVRYGPNPCASADILSSDQVRVTQLIFQKTSDTIFVDLSVAQKNSNAQKSESSQITLSSAVVPRASLY